MLHAEGGEYDPEAVAFYDGLRTHFGASFQADGAAA
jgi:hypothetical protein